MEKSLDPFSLLPAASKSARLVHHLLEFRSLGLSYHGAFAEFLAGPQLHKLSILPVRTASSQPQSCWPLLPQVVLLAAFVWTPLKLSGHPPTSYFKDKTQLTFPYCTRGVLKLPPSCVATTKGPDLLPECLAVPPSLRVDKAMS